MSNPETVEVPQDWLPVMIWPKYFYKQQIDFTMGHAWHNWFIAGNGTGKTLILSWNAIAFMLGVHPLQADGFFPKPPLTLRFLVPSFDHVRDVILDKFYNNQTIVFPGGRLDVGPMMPKSMVIPKRDYNKDHKGIELKNGSSVWFATEGQGWEDHRGKEHDILLMDEENEERVFDENVRGLRNAKGGGRIIAGLTPPYKEGQGPTWTKRKIIDLAPGDPDMNVVHACMADNPAITKEFIKRFSKGKSKKMIDVMIYGRYPTWGDVIYPHFQNRKWNPEEHDGHILPIDFELPEPWDVKWVMAFDWHAAKPCAGVWGFVDPDNNLIIFEETDKNIVQGMPISDLVDYFHQIEGFPHSRRRFTRWQDPSAKAKYHAQIKGFNAWDEFKKYGIVTAEGKNRDPLLGISMVNDYFKGDSKYTPRLFIRENCVYTIQYLENHFWKKNLDTGRADPDPIWSDYPVCIKYIVQELGQKHKRGIKKEWPLYSVPVQDSSRASKWTRNFERVMRNVN